jgi:hypothetical protein
MNFTQLSAMRAWMLAHRATRPVEYHTWDAVLTLWLMGWMGAPAFLLLDEPWEVLACVALFFVPPAYLKLRQRLHQKDRLRCDWLDTVQPHTGRAAR